MNKILENLRRQLNLELDRNNTKEIIRLRKELLKYEDNEELEELNSLFDNLPVDNFDNKKEK